MTSIASRYVTYITNNTITVHDYIVTKVASMSV